MEVGKMFFRSGEGKMTLTNDLPEGRILNYQPLVIRLLQVFFCGQKLTLSTKIHQKTQRTHQ